MRRLAMVLFALVSVLVLGACESNPAKGQGPILDSKGQGGGFAILRSGEYLSIGDDGAVTGRCYLCESASDGNSECAGKAKALGIPVCKTPEAAPTAKSLRSTLMCTTYGPSGVLPPVPFGTPGYSCFMTSPRTCICMLN